MSRDGQVTSERHVNRRDVAARLQDMRGGKFGGRSARASGARLSKSAACARSVVDAAPPTAPNVLARGHSGQLRLGDGRWSRVRHGPGREADQRHALRHGARRRACERLLARARPARPISAASLQYPRVATRPKRAGATCRGQDQSLPQAIRRRRPSAPAPRQRSSRVLGSRLARRTGLGVSRSAERTVHAWSRLAIVSVLN